MNNHVKKLKNSLNELNWFVKMKKYSLDKEAFERDFVSRSEFNKLLEQYEEVVKEANFYKKKYNEEKLKLKSIERENQILKIYIKDLLQFIDKLKDNFTKKILFLQKKFCSQNNHKKFESDSNLNIESKKEKFINQADEIKKDLENIEKEKSRLRQLVEEKLKNNLNSKKQTIDLYS